jgi:HEAT repeat protein
MKNWIREALIRPWLRIGLAAALLIAAMAPIGAPILSDTSWRGAPAPEAGAAEAFTYQWAADADGTTRVERSDDGGRTWHRVAAIPQPAVELEAVRGMENLVFARSSDAIWASEDGGNSWSQAARLPSRPLALAVSHTAPGTLFAGTESGGLLRSNDRGASWQAVGSVDLLLNGAGALAVTDVAINPEDEQVMYAATGVWLGATHARLSPLGTFISVDGGREWFELSRAALGAAPVTAITPMPGSPAAVTVTDENGTQTLRAAANAGLLAALDADEPARRAAAARLLRLIGDAAAFPALSAHLNDPDALVGERIVEAMARLDADAALPELRAALESAEDVVQARAAYGLGLLRDEASVAALGAMLRSGEPMAARRAAEALGAIGTPEAAGALIAPLGDVEGSPAQHHARAALEGAGGGAGSSAVAALETSLNAENPALRANAAEMLGWVSAPGSAAALAGALNDPDPMVRAQAAWALGQVGTDEAQAALAQAARVETDAAVRTSAEDALARAEMAARSSVAAEASPGAAMLAALGEIPPTRWTFLGLSIVLALALILAKPGQMRPQGR